MRPLARPEAGIDAPIGVLLLYMGGASTIQEIKPFLYHLFSDRLILPLPSPLRIPLAWLISRTRYYLVKKRYDRIGGSPLLDITMEQAKALKGVLEEDGIEAQVEVGMRYSPPFIYQAVERLKDKGVKRAIALTLYPQYSKATAGSCLMAMKEAVRQTGLEVVTIPHWHTHPSFINTWVGVINGALPSLQGNPHILFSAHSLPMRIVRGGDPYPEQVEETIEAIMTKLGPMPYSLAYQSKVGPVKWLGPSVEQELARLVRQGVHSLALVPISFVSEHLETLYEIDIILRGEALRLGIETFVRVPALNLHPGLIHTWKELILEHLP